MHALLLLLLGLGGAQFLVAVAALLRGRQSHRAGAPSHARYSFSHAGLLAVGSLVLGVPLLLGLFDVIRESVAVFVALALEAVVLPVARRALDRFEAAHHARRPA